MRRHLALCLLLLPALRGEDAPPPTAPEAIPVAAALPAPLVRAQAAARSMPALRLPFEQVKHLAILDAPLVTPGVVEIDRAAGALRWEFTGQAVLILARGRLRRWGADGQEEDLGRDPGVQALTGQFQAMITGDWGPLTTLFRCAVDAGGGDRVRFIPREAAMARFLEALVIAVGADGVPTAMTLEVAGGDRTDYRFAAPDPGYVPRPARFQGP